MDQAGGKYYDSGMYGCIFTGRLLCKDGKPVGNPTKGRPLTKIQPKQDAIQEYQIATVIRKIPQWRQYFAVAEAICEPAVQQTEKELDRCELLDGAEMSDLRILSMTHRGVPLHRYAFPLRQGFEFGRFAQHLIEAGAILGLYGVVHRDMNRGNILVDPHMVPRIIDFGLSVRVKGTTADDLRHGMSFTITQEPLDSVLVNGVAVGYQIPKIIAAILTKKTTLGVLQTVLGMPRAKMEEELWAYAERTEVQAGDLDTWFETSWKGIDSWAIGVALTETIQKLSVWPEFSWDKARWIPVLRQMCAINPMKRISCLRALQILQPTHMILRTRGGADEPATQML